MNKKIILISIIFAFLIALIPLRADWSFDKSLEDGLVSIKLSSVTEHLNYCSAYYYYYSYKCPCSGNYRQRKYCSSSGWCGSCKKYKYCGSSYYQYQCSGSYVQRRYVSKYCSGNSCRTSYGSWRNYRYCGSSYYQYRCYSSYYGSYVQRRYVRKYCSGTSCYTSYGSWSNYQYCGSSYYQYRCYGSYVQRRYVSKYCSGTSCRTSYGSWSNYKYCGSRTSTISYFCRAGTNERWKKTVYSGGCLGTSCQKSDSTIFNKVEDCKYDCVNGECVGCYNALMIKDLRNCRSCKYYSVMAKNDSIKKFFCLTRLIPEAFAAPGPAYSGWWIFCDVWACPQWCDGKVDWDNCKYTGWGEWSRCSLPCYTSGACASQGGTCGNPAACTGTIKTGLCPGGTDCVCCIPLPDCGHTCLSHGTASVAWPDCSCTRRSPASGYKIIGTWNSSDCRQCTGYKRVLPDCGHTCVNHGTASHLWPDCSCTRRSPASGYKIIGTWNSSDCPKCTGYRKIGCSCTSWANGACGGGSCSATQRQQTRTCTPSGCDKESRCVADSACVSSPILNLTANPPSVIKDQRSRLSWFSTNTTSCTAPWTESKSTSGNKWVYPSNTTTYSMKCTGPGGSISRSTTVTVITVIPNQPPSATNLKVVQPDYCLSGPAGFFSWTFTDPDPGDTQSAYRVQVDNNSNFSKPEDDSGKVTSASNSYATILGKLKYNNTYYWRLKVWDNKGLDSIWISGPSFSTPTHACPEIDFSWSPFKPSVNEDVLFVDQSTVYGGTTKESWSWTFQDGSPDSSNEQNPTAKFPSTGEKDITLRVTDSDGFSCSRTKTLNSQLPLPIWKEIAPF